MENHFRFKTYQKHWSGEQSKLADFGYLEAAPERSPLSLATMQQARARA